MAWPSSLDNLPTTHVNTDEAENLHPQLHNEANGAINSIEAALGLSPQGSAASVAARLVAIEAAITGSTAITPESFGAKADLKYVMDAATTATSKTLTSATASFTSADVGKVINIRGAGESANKGMLTTKISAVTNSTTITLESAANTTVTAKCAIYGTDDTIAIREAINFVVTEGLAKGTYFGEVVLKGRYMVAGTPIKGGSTLGNSQIPIPVITPTSQMKFRLVLKCPGHGAPLLHWHQTHPQMSGAVLFSPLIAAAADGTYSVPSVIGGPTVLSLDEGTTGFSNMSFELAGSLTILMPRHANHMAMDLGLIGQADLDSLAILANGSAAELKEDADAKSYATNGEGLRMPKLNNNDASYIRSLSVEGITYALAPADHFTVDRLATIYCKVNMFILTSGAASHGIYIGNWSCEGGTTVIECEASAGARFPITISRLDVEDSSGVGVDFIDSHNALRGTVQFGTDNEHRAPTKTGAEHLKVTDNQNTE